MKIINIIVVLSALTLASCEEWLDLKPDTQATEEQVSQHRRDITPY